jgi:hypothetical protein
VTSRAFTRARRVPMWSPRAVAPLDRFRPRRPERSPGCGQWIRTLPTNARQAVMAATAVAAPVPLEYKTCPDRAEEVRYAVRKCRFCGFMFDRGTS